MEGITIPVFRSRQRGACNERAFMLHAVGIPTEIVFDSLQFVVLVAESDAPSALTHLSNYERERLPRPPPPPPLPRLPHAWVGCVVYAVLLVTVGLLVSNGFWRLDAFDVGELDAARVQQGQWWRAWTALTLHRDGQHLVANLGAGIWFGYLAARQVGSGLSWLLTVTAAAAANLVEGLTGPGTHRSVGASTAVFAALGVLSAHSWRMQAPLLQQWALRWAPLVGGIALLAWFGAGDQDATDPLTHPDVHTDVVAHVLGFVAGVGLGAIAARSHQRLLGWIPQWLAGVAAVASIVIAWAFALSS